MLDFTPSGWELWDPDSLTLADDDASLIIEADGVPYDETSLPTFLHRVFYHISHTLVMFIGRLGPLLVAVAISRRGAVSYSFAEENIIIG